MTTSKAVKGVVRIPHRYSRTSLHHFDSGARKRPVNLTLNEDAVQQARGMTDEYPSLFRD
jgi:hypothetical protein